MLRRNRGTFSLRRLAERRYWRPKTSETGNRQSTRYLGTRYPRHRWTLITEIIFNHHKSQKSWAPRETGNILRNRRNVSTDFTHYLLPTSQNLQYNNAIRLRSTLLSCQPPPSFRPVWYLVKDVGRRLPYKNSCDSVTQYRLVVRILYANNRLYRLAQKKLL